MSAVTVTPSVYWIPGQIGLIDVAVSEVSLYHVELTDRAAYELAVSDVSQTE
jgi:hypothetical protein